MFKYIPSQLNMQKQVAYCGVIKNDIIKLNHPDQPDTAILAQPMVRVWSETI